MSDIRNAELVHEGYTNFQQCRNKYEEYPKELREMYELGFMTAFSDMYNELKSKGEIKWKH